MLRTVLALTMTATTLAAQSPFEGAITMTISDDGKSTDVGHLVKDGTVRRETVGNRGESVAMIFDLAAKQTLTTWAGAREHAPNPENDR